MWHLLQFNAVAAGIGAGCARGSEGIVLERVVSGGQTGVDRAALDAAMALGLACGGWCPRGRRAEDGAIPSRYPLRETHGIAYPERTAWNVRDSDATLVLTLGRPRGGTALTISLARKAGKPVMVVDLNADGPAATEVRAWLDREGVRILNVAGPRESQAPGAHARASRFLLATFGPAPP